MDSLFLITSNFYVYDLISILIIYQSLIFGLFLLVKKRPKTRLNNILIFIYATIFLHFGYILIENNWLKESYMFGIFFGLIYGPIMYIYTYGLIIKHLKATRAYIHFVPAAFAFIAIVIFIISNNKTILSTNAAPSFVVTIHICSYLVLSLFLIKKYNSQLKFVQSSLDRISLTWLKAIIYILFGSILLALTQSIISSAVPYYNDILITTIFILVLVLVNSFYYLGLRQVELFSGFDEKEIEQTSQKGKYQIDPKEKEALLNALNNYLDSEKPYLEFEISLNDIATFLSTSPRKISFLLNDTYQKNFFDFINSYRIKEVKQLLSETDKSIKEIMYDCGFGSKSSFNSIFKKFTGQTPSSFRNNRS